jgi:cysteine desulfurase/selenocysteine lyase
MSTSNLGAADLPALEAGLDVAAIARLANEFFAALPQNPGPPAGLPGPLPAATDSVAPPATAAGAAAFGPANPGAVPVHGAPGSPAYIYHAADPAPLNVAPSFSEPSGLFSFPSVPGMQPVPETPAIAAPLPEAVALPATAPVAQGGPYSMPDALALTQLANQVFAALPAHAALPEAAPPPPSSDPRAQMAGVEGVAPASLPQWPPMDELFSFPSVPGVPSVPTVPGVPGLPPPPGMTLVPDTASAPALPAAPNVPAYSPEPERFSPFDAAPSFPVTSDLFILPGVPGAQSLPGTPVLPSSPPTPPESPPGAPPEPPPGTPPEALRSQGGFWGTRRRGLPEQGVRPTDEPFDFRPEMTPDLGRAKRPFDPHMIRRDFPILQERVHGRPLIWLDNAATTQKPNAVIDRLSHFYHHENSNVHRAAHTLAARATDAYESAREKVRRFLNASSTREIVFVRGTTEGINLVAQAWGRRNVQKDDEVVITWLEHHANIVPWQQLCAEKGARLRVAPVDDRGEVILEEYEKLLGPRTRIVAFSQVSNALGTVTPACEMVEMAHRHGARVLVDGAQSVAHMRTNLQALDCDFFVFSGHKIFGPTGIGVIYGKADILDNTPPWQGGGSMIVDVTFEKTVYQQAPARFEAGTGNIADAVGLGAALDYLDEIGIDMVTRYEHELLTYATAALIAIPGLRLIGTAREKAGVLSFVLDEFRTEDVGVALNQEGIAVRAGHHCAQPILRRFGVESTVRPSLALYNTTEDIDALAAAILRMQAGRRHGKI